MIWIDPSKEASAGLTFEKCLWDSAGQFNALEEVLDLRRTGDLQPSGQVQLLELEVSV